MTISGGATCAFTNGDTQTKFVYSSPVTAKFIRYTGASCSATAWFNVKSGEWVEGPNFWNGICSIYFQIYNPNGGDQTITLYRAKYG